METPWIFFSWLWLQKAISYILFYPIGCPVTCLQVLIGSSLVVVFYQSSKSHLHIRDLSSVSPPRSLGNVKWNTIKGEPAVIHEHAPFGEVFSVMDEPDNTHFWDMSQFPWGFKKKFFFHKPCFEMSVISPYFISCWKSYIYYIKKGNELSWSTITLQEPVLMLSNDYLLL